MSPLRVALVLLLALAALPALAQAAGTVTVTCAAGEARVSVDDRPAGTTPATLSLPPGPHRLRVVRDGLPAFEQEITVQAGGTQAVDAVLTLPAGPCQVLYVDSGDLRRVAEAWRSHAGADPALQGATWMSPAARGWIALAPEALQAADPEAAARVALALSKRLETGVLHLAITPDERAWYFYARDGELLDRYCSNPGPEGLRAWAGRPHLLLPVCRGKPLSAKRSEVTITDLNGLVYFYTPEMRRSKPGAWRSAAAFMQLLTQVLGTPQRPAPLEALSRIPGWKKL